MTFASTQSVVSGVQSPKWLMFSGSAPLSVRAVTAVWCHLLHCGNWVLIRAGLCLEVCGKSKDFWMNKASGLNCFCHCSGIYCTFALGQWPLSCGDCVGCWTSVAGIDWEPYVASILLSDPEKEDETRKLDLCSFWCPWSTKSCIFL